MTVAQRLVNVNFETPIYEEFLATRGIVSRSSGTDCAYPCTIVRCKDGLEYHYSIYNAAFYRSRPKQNGNLYGEAIDKAEAAYDEFLMNKLKATNSAEYAKRIGWKQEAEMARLKYEEERRTIEKFYADAQTLRFMFNPPPGSCPTYGLKQLCHYAKCLCVRPKNLPIPLDENIANLKKHIATTGQNITKMSDLVSCRTVGSEFFLPPGMASIRQEILPLQESYQNLGIAEERVEQKERTNKETLALIENQQKEMLQDNAASFQAIAEGKSAHELLLKDIDNLTKEMAQRNEKQQSEIKNLIDHSKNIQLMITQQKQIQELVKRLQGSSIEF